MSTLRKLKRQIKKNRGKLPMKKAIAHRTGKTLAEVNEKYFKKDEVSKDAR